MTGKTPQGFPSLPEQALNLDTNEVARNHLRVLQEQSVDGLPSSVIEGARTIGAQIWPSVPGGAGGH